MGIEGYLIVSPEDKLVFSTDLCGKIAQQLKALGGSEPSLKHVCPAMQLRDRTLLAADRGAIFWDDAG